MHNHKEQGINISSAAQEYINLGFHILPLWSVNQDGSCRCGKPDCKDPGKHPRGDLVHHGCNYATNDPETTSIWFSTDENNIGIATGSTNGVIVLDVDPRNGGNETLADLEGEFGKLPPTMKVRTGDGCHYYFKSEGDEIKGGNNKLGPGLDIKGRGGYVVAPPSRHESGKCYVLENRAPIVEMPRWMTECMAKSERDKRTIMNGDRNDKLTSIAGSLRQQGHSQGQIENQLSSANRERCNPPVSEAEVAKIAASVARYPTGSVTFEFTDLGNAERLAHQHGDKLRFCQDTNKWYFYDGKRWNMNIGNEKIQQAASKTIKSIHTEALTIEDSEKSQKMHKWAMSSQQGGRINSMISLAKNTKPIPVYSKDFDCDPFLLNCLNGTINLVTGKLQCHDQNDMITKLSPVRFDPDASFEQWDRFLETTTQNDPELMQFLKTAAGYSATGSTDEEKLFFVHGPTASGKSTFLEAIKATLGDYAKTTDFETFLKRTSTGGIRNDTARLAGSRFVVSIEVDEGKQLAEGLIKTLTGGDTVTTRFLYQEYFEFMPQFKLWLAANDAPKARDTDGALWRRILRVPFDNTIPKENRDPKLKSLLKTRQKAGPAVLAWIVQGALEWQKNGLLVPEIIEKSTEEYRESQDPLKDFLEDECEFGDGLYVPTSKLRTAYEDHAKEIGLRYTMSPTEFNKRLQAKNCTRKSMRVDAKPQKCWIGVNLKTPI